VIIERAALRDVVTQLDVLWVVLFSLVGCPTAMIVFWNAGLGGLLLPVATSTLVLVALRYAWLRREHPRYFLDFSDDRCFALHTGNPRRARLIGRADWLELTSGNADPSTLVGVTFRYAESEIRSYGFTDRDIIALRHVTEAYGVRR
jgi:hypothetical protein